MPQYFGVLFPLNLRSAALLCFSLAALCAGNAAFALTRAELFQATAPMADRSEGAQTAAFEAAMKTVLIRVTGRRTVDDDAALSPLIGNARRYVQQYRAAPDGQVWVSFDGPAIERWLTQNGQPLWGHERPMTFVWLTAQTGPQSGVLITAEDTSELKAAIDAAATVRGVPLIWPSASDAQRNHMDYAAVNAAAPSTLADIGRRSGGEGDTHRQSHGHGRDGRRALDAFVPRSQQRIFRPLGGGESYGGCVCGSVCRQRQSRPDRDRGNRNRRS